jgi:hypothetical protein
MDELINKLNNRFDDVLSKVSDEFIFELCDYLDLYQTEGALKQIMAHQQTLDIDHYQCIWRPYQQLMTEIYLPIKENPSTEAVKKLFKSFFDREESEVRNIDILANPLGWKAWWQRQRFVNRLDRVHKRTIKTLEDMPKPKATTSTTAIQPSKLQTALGITSISRWKDITWKFCNSYDVQVSYNGKQYKTDKDELGFGDGRIKTEAKPPKKSWVFLQNLSINKGAFLMEEYVTSHDRDILRKSKQYITSQFKKIFGINNDPFEQYYEEKQSYQIKISMIPEKDFRPDFRDRNIFTDDEFSD